MKNKELIEFLSKQDPDLRVMVSVCGGNFDIYEPRVIDGDNERLVIL